jgi:hypothetical protein
MIHRQIEDECPDAVLWAVATGRFLELTPKANGRGTRGHGLEVLVVTNLSSLYKAHVLLAEKVFGPVLFEFGEMPILHVWTAKEAKIAVKSRNSTVRRALKQGITVYGSPEVVMAPLSVG